MPSGRYYTVDAKGNKRYYAANNTELNATYFLQKEGMKLDKNKNLVKITMPEFLTKMLQLKRGLKLRVQKQEEPIL